MPPTVYLVSWVHASVSRSLPPTSIGDLSRAFEQDMVFDVPPREPVSHRSFNGLKRALTLWGRWMCVLTSLKTNGRFQLWLSSLQENCHPNKSARVIPARRSFPTLRPTLRQRPPSGLSPSSVNNVDDKFLGGACSYPACTCESKFGEAI